MESDTDHIAAQQAQLRQWSIDGTADFTRTFGVAPGRWLQMEAESGVEGAIKRLLSPDWPETSWVPVLTQLWEAHRLQWSAEAAALRFSLLFGPEHRAEAQRRLEQFGYDADANSTER